MWTSLFTEYYLNPRNKWLQKFDEASCTWWILICSNFIYFSKHVNWSEEQVKTSLASYQILNDLKFVYLHPLLFFHFLLSFPFPFLPFQFSPFSVVSFFFLLHHSIAIGRENATQTWSPNLFFPIPNLFSFFFFSIYLPFLFHSQFFHLRQDGDGS